MENKTKAVIYYSVSLVLSAWFALTCWVWAYLVNVLFSFPAGALGFISWLMGRRYNRAHILGSISVWLLRFGVCLAVMSFLFFYLSS